MSTDPTPCHSPPLVLSAHRGSRRDSSIESTTWTALWSCAWRSEDLAENPKEIRTLHPELVLRDVPRKSVERRPHAQRLGEARSPPRHAPGSAAPRSSRDWPPATPPASAHGAAADTPPPSTPAVGRRLADQDGTISGNNSTVDDDARRACLALIGPGTARDANSRPQCRADLAVTPTAARLARCSRHQVVHFSRAEAGHFSRASKQMSLCSKGCRAVSLFGLISNRTGRIACERSAGGRLAGTVSRSDPMT